METSSGLTNPFLFISWKGLHQATLFIGTGDSVPSPLPHVAAPCRQASTAGRTAGHAPPRPSSNHCLLMLLLIVVIGVLLLLLRSVLLIRRRRTSLCHRSGKGRLLGHLVQQRARRVHLPRS